VTWISSHTSTGHSSNVNLKVDSKNTTCTHSYLIIALTLFYVTYELTNTPAFRQEPCEITLSNVYNCKLIERVTYWTIHQQTNLWSVKSRTGRLAD